MNFCNMWKENLYQQSEVLLREHDVFPIGEHQHSFFEMAYIVSGTGYFSAVSPSGAVEEHDYRAGCLFLVPPDTAHLFVIHTHSRFVFLRFTQAYVADSIGSFAGGVLHISSGYRLCLPPADRVSAAHVVSVLSAELQAGHRFSALLVQHCVVSMVLLAARSLSGAVSEQDASGMGRAYMLMQYVQQHIHCPELLRQEALAQKFNLSPAYVGRFFKRNFGEDLRSYVSASRLRRVADMLVSTSLSVKEIAVRMGYADTCYLDRVFAGHYGMSPVQFRKRNAGRRSFDSLQ